MYTPNAARYQDMPYRRVGRSGLLLPAVSLGFWQNFSHSDSFANMQQMCRAAFDAGVVHFDLANNYGHPHRGAAEENLGRILATDLRGYRDELCISSKAGYDMWEGPYGRKHGARKYLISSLDASLGRMGLDYVDVFYHHVYDPTTPAEEVALALDHITRVGKAIYVGISNYNKKQTEEILSIFRELKTPFVLNQPSYSMLNRWIETDGLREYAKEQGFGLAVFSPLAQGMLTGKFLPGGSGTANREWMRRRPDDSTMAKLTALAEVAADRGQTLSQLALSWALRDEAVATVLIGASSPAHIIENARAADKCSFADEELARIEQILA